MSKILEFRMDVEILEPKELRQKIAETLRSASAMYVCSDEY
ncbi:WYL domain-containing protein [Runella salmonicolor]|uniref:WYL domain-containing protein n=1 Tax=Runella salmonicolor TaxID=2950278 RepID=A0ABT1FR82_9BACT|nr:WYL domain-containing protein [Runella salmonicolor]MCP1384239.1 WYL domain-containing protein [Runella salmonicolor]